MGFIVGIGTTLFTNALFPLSDPINLVNQVVYRTIGGDDFAVEVGCTVRLHAVSPGGAPKGSVTLLVQLERVCGKHSQRLLL